MRELATGTETVVAGGPGESVTEPQWRPDGTLTFLSDRSGWWNPYRWTPGGSVEVLVAVEAEVGVPGWQLGGSRYAVLDQEEHADGGRLVFARSSRGFDALAVREPDGTVSELDVPFSVIRSVRADGPGAVLCVAGSPTVEPGVHRVVLGPHATRVETLRAPRELGVLDPAVLSVPEPMTFTSVDADGAPRTAHALFYPPGGAHSAPADELPPLLTVLHGGPTGSAVPVLALGVQYWTSRGFAVASRAE